MSHAIRLVHLSYGHALKFGLAIVVFWLSVSAWAEDEDWPLSDRLLDSFTVGNTERVLADAPRVLLAEPNNHELRLAYAKSLLWTGELWAAAGQYQLLLPTKFGGVARLGMANAMAWSGRLVESIPYYESVLGGESDKEARLGLANAHRWRGRPDLALAHYQKLLQDDASNTDAADGIRYVERELRPRTMVGASFSTDSSPMTRHEWIASHRWRDASKARIFSIEQVYATDDNTVQQRHLQELIGRLELTDVALEPLFEISQVNTPHTNTFAQLRLRFGQSPTYVKLGRVNWGKLSFNNGALDLGLTANHLGIDSTVPSPVGEFRAVVNWYEVSDNNRIDSGDVRWIPLWRPFNKNVRPHVGVSWRYAKQVAATYWSPTAFAVGYFGLERRWDSVDGYASIFASIGAPLAGEASTYWSAGLVWRRWLSRDWAIGSNAWTQSNGQGSQYRTYGVSLQLEKLW